MNDTRVDIARAIHTAAIDHWGYMRFEKVVKDLAKKIERHPEWLTDVDRDYTAWTAEAIAELWVGNYAETGKLPFRAVTDMCAEENCTLGSHEGPHRNGSLTWM